MDRTRRMGNKGRLRGGSTEGKKMASETQLTARRRQGDEVRQEEVCDGRVRHGEGFCNFASGASEAPDAN